MGAGTQPPTVNITPSPIQYTAAGVSRDSTVVIDSIASLNDAVFGIMIEPTQTATLKLRKSTGWANYTENPDASRWLSTYLGGSTAGGKGRWVGFRVLQGDLPSPVAEKVTLTTRLSLSPFSVVSPAFQVIPMVFASWPGDANTSLKGGQYVLFVSAFKP